MTDALFFLYSILGRIKDVFKTPAGHKVFPSQIEDALYSEPQGLVSDVVAGGVTPIPRSKDERAKVPRAWVVLSDEGKKLGVEAAIKELELWCQKTLSDHIWLNGGIEILDEVCMTVNFKQAHFMNQIFNVDSQSDLWKAGKPESNIAKTI